MPRAALLAAIFVCACGPGGSSTVPSASESADQPPALMTPAATQQPTSTAASAAPVPSSSATFTNPVINVDFPDPFVANFDGTYYAYATGTSGKRLQVATSADLVHWDTPAEALLNVPRWMIGDTWAPEVTHTSAGYVMYFSGRNGAVDLPNGQGTPCLSVAVADDADGPFTPASDEPLVCQEDLGGAIDPTVFVGTDDGGQSYLIWKNDGNCCGIPTRFWMQQLSDDGLTLTTGEPTDLGMVNDATWEAGVIEAPTLITHGGEFVMLYSANRYETHRYAVGYATSSDLDGPYVDGDNPILVNAAPAIGPGHQSVVNDDDGDLWLAYHAWDVTAVGYESGGRRALWLDPLTFEGDRPVVNGPNPNPQPVP